MKKKTQIWIGAGIIAAALLFLMVSSFTQSSVYYYTLDELAGLQVSPQQRIRVSGQLVKESIQYDPTQPLLRFTIQNSDSTYRLNVVYHDVMPDNFLRSEEVVATGYLKGTTFEADQLLIKCPSKYVPEEQETAGGS